MAHLKNLVVPEGFITQKEAGEILGVHLSTIHRLAAEKALDRKRIGDAIVVPLHQVINLKKYNDIGRYFIRNPEPTVVAALFSFVGGKEEFEAKMKELRDQE